MGDEPDWKSIATQLFYALSVVPWPTYDDAKCDAATQRYCEARIAVDGEDFVSNDSQIEENDG
jgi:hypothetical protein